MEDESIFTRGQCKEISEGLQSFIDSMVEEIVLEDKPFDTQKKYLKKFSENEGVDYDKLEADITTFIEILDSFKTAFSKLQVKLAEEKGHECYISKDMQDKLIKHSSPVKENPEINVDPVPNTINEEHKRFSLDSWLWAISAFFMVFVYSQIVALTSCFSSVYSFYGDRRIVPAILLAGLAFLCWILRKKGNTVLVMWGLAAIWLLVYWQHYMCYVTLDDYTIVNVKVNAILNLLAIIVIVILAISYVRKKKNSEIVALVTATISSIMILNPMAIFFSQGFMSVLSVFLIVSIITVVIKLREKTSTIRILHIISTALACYYIIAYLFDAYLYYIGNGYKTFNSFVIGGVLCSVIVITLIIAWTKHNILEEVITLLFCIIPMLCMSHLMFGLNDSLRFWYEWNNDYNEAFNLLCHYAPIFIFWTVFICSYLIYLLHSPNNQNSLSHSC